MGRLVMEHLGMGRLVRIRFCKWILYFDLYAYIYAWSKTSSVDMNVLQDQRRALPGGDWEAAGGGGEAEAAGEDSQDL